MAPATVADVFSKAQVSFGADGRSSTVGMPRRLTAEARRTADGTFADEEPSEGSAAAAAVAFDFDEEERDEGGGGELRCATLNGLVRRLTHHSIREAHFLDAFLLTYRSFTTPLELLALLKSRFAVPMPHGLVPAERLRYQRMIVEPIRHRVVNVLRHWVTHHFDDFEAEHEHAKEGERIEGLKQPRLVALGAHLDELGPFLCELYVMRSEG